LKKSDHSIFTVLPRLVGMLLDANENTHVEMEQREGTQFSFVETGFASGLDRNMSKAVRQRLFDNGYSTTQKALAFLN
jgi:NTE family protein